MNNIYNLVSDIYALLEKDTPLTTAQAETLGDRLKETIIRRLATKPEKRGVSMSSFGSKCWRKLWYQEKTPEIAEPLSAPTKIKFLMGDIAEDVTLALAEATEKHTVSGRQDTLEVNGLQGHRDAVIDGVLVDVKSANSRGFTKFKDHKLEVDDPFGYLDQISLYLEGSKDDETVKVKGQAAFLAVDKELGNLVLDVYSKRDKDYPSEIDRLRKTLEADSPPQRAFSPVDDGFSGNQVLCVECRYCPFKKECWKDANNGHGLRKFIYSTGPRWFTKVVKEPNVPEASS